MRLRRHAIGIVAGVTALGCFAYACAPAESVSLLQQASGDLAAPKLFVALGDVSLKDDPDAFRLYAYAPTQDVDPTSVKFCFATIELCSQGTGTTLTGEAIDVDGKQVIQTSSPIRLRHDLRLTVIARDRSGGDLTTGITIANKGMQPTAQQTPASTTDTISGGATGGLNTNPTTDPLNPSGDNAGNDSLLDSIFGDTFNVLDESQDGSSSLGNTSCYKAPDAFTCDVEHEIARLTNQKRQENGLNALTYDRKMAFVSRLWSQEQARQGAISHDWFINGTWAEKYSAEFGESSPTTSENVAMNRPRSSATETAAAFVEQWWNSSGHRENMLGSGINAIGVGYFRSGDNAFGTQNFGSR